MKKIYSIIAILYIIYLFIFNKEIVTYLHEVNILFFSNYIVSLFPFILAINLLLKSDVLISIHSFIKKKKIDFCFEIIIIILIILIGVPGNLNLLNYLEKTKMISSRRKSALLNSFGGISFSFLYFVILNKQNYKLFILILLVFIETINYLLYRNKEANEQINYLPYCVNIVKHTGFALYVVFFSLISFSSLTILLNQINKNYSYFFKGLIEFSYNLIKLSENNSLISTLQSSFLISFTSISLIAQIKLIDSSFNIIDYIKKRAIIALLVTTIIYLYL